MQSSAEPDSIVHKSFYCFNGWTFYVVLTNKYLVAGKTIGNKQNEILAAINKAVGFRSNPVQSLSKFVSLGYQPVGIPLQFLKSIEWVKSGQTTDAVIRFDSPRKPNQDQKYRVIFGRQDERKLFVESLKSTATTHGDFEARSSFWYIHYSFPGLAGVVFGLLICLSSSALQFRPQGSLRGLKKLIAEACYALGPTGLQIAGLSIALLSLACWFIAYHFYGATNGVKFSFEGGPKTSTQEKSRI